MKIRRLDGRLKAIKCSLSLSLSLSREHLTTKCLPLLVGFKEELNVWFIEREREKEGGLSSSPSML